MTLNEILDEIPISIKNKDGQSLMFEIHRYDDEWSAGYYHMSFTYGPDSNYENSGQTILEACIKVYEDLKFNEII